MVSVEKVPIFSRTRSVDDWAAASKVANRLLESPNEAANPTTVLREIVILNLALREAFQGNENIK